MRYFSKIFLLLIFTTYVGVSAQNRSEALKRQALILMKEGRFGEAVDQLNKYISANPRLSDGYHLRGLCYEQKTQYQFAALDLRRARRLNPNDEKIKSDLDRVITVWHEELYQKIDGHKRDIAVNPKYPFSYLEIGKSYRWLEEWEMAENWYDEYLKRDEKASPDEIIRYTEILAKTGSIVKGEKILKNYVERYPDDWRLWSRYGYFTLWLGKNKVAKDAFKKSLSFKPFFKEAQDGLDLASKQGYVPLYVGRKSEITQTQEYPIDRYNRLITQNPDDDDSRFNLVNELVNANRYEEALYHLKILSSKHSNKDIFKSQWKTVTEYRDSIFNSNIQRYTEVLKNNPADKDAVKKLAESYAQLFYYDNAIRVLSEYLQDRPEDQNLDIRFDYAKYCAWNYERERSIDELDKLLKIEPSNLDYQLLRGQLAIWTLNEIDLAEKYLLNVAETRPRDISTLISVSSLYLWKKNFTESKKYLDRAKVIDPKNPEIGNAESNYASHLSAFEEMKISELRVEAGRLAKGGNCDAALAKYEEYRTKRADLSNEELFEYAEINSCTGNFDKAIETYDKLLKDQFDYSLAFLRAKNIFFQRDTLLAVKEFESLAMINPEDSDLQIYLADSYALANQLSKAEMIYRRLKSKSASTEKIKELDKKILYLSDYYVAGKQFDKAKSVFEELLKKEKDASFIKEINQRRIFLAEALVQNKKYKEAEDLFDELNETITIPELRKDLNTKRIYLGDAYVAQEEFGDAEDIYNDLLENATDTTEIRMLNERISWLPPSIFSRGITSVGNFLSNFLPSNFGWSPFSNYYRDNLRYQLVNYGSRADIRFGGFLLLGAIYSRTAIDNYIIKKEFTQMKGIATLQLSDYLSLSGKFGYLSTIGESNQQLGDASLLFEKSNEFSFSLSYESIDARMLFYSPNILSQIIRAEHYKSNAYYIYRKNTHLSILYNYFKLDDGNLGNDLQFKFGKNYFDNGIFGYEFYFADYGFVSPFYYSPQNYESHSLWTEWEWLVYNNLKVKASGKIGYIPNIDFVISEIFSEANYNPYASLLVTGKITYSNSFRFGASYRNISLSLSASLGIF